MRRASQTLVGHTLDKAQVQQHHGCQSARNICRPIDTVQHRWPDLFWAASPNSTERTSPDVRVESASGGTTEVALRGRQGSFIPEADLSSRQSVSSPDARRYSAMNRRGGSRRTVSLSWNGREDCFSDAGVSFLRRSLGSSGRHGPQNVNAASLSRNHEIVTCGGYIPYLAGRKVVRVTRRHYIVAVSRHHVDRPDRPMAQRSVLQTCRRSQ